MGLYSILTVFFLIGRLGIVVINQKSSSVVANLERWKKFRVYVLLVFSQLYLLDHQKYFYFAVVVIIIGLYEILKVSKSSKYLLFSLSIYTVVSVFFVLFFKEYQVQWQQFIFIIVITFDGYSQISGQLFGKTKLFPQTSPGKTLEGLLGGIFSVVFTALILANLMHIGTIKAVVFGLVIAVLAIIGDFLASLAKRRAYVKDFSSLIPGHGGILDRFDSLIFAVSGCYLWLKLDFSSNGLIACIYVFLFLIIFAIAEVLYHNIKCKAEISRKFVHVSSGIACLSFPFFLQTHWFVLLLCAGFILILMVSLQCNKLPSINNIGRKSYGSWLFPVSVYVCFLCFAHFHQYEYFYLPILILAVCDPIAALVGKKWKYGRYSMGVESKTAMGSSAFLVSCFLILAFSFGMNIPLGKCLLIAAIATTTEAVSKRGSDNLTIPAVVLLCLIAL
jgi:CDP-diglyceride synthetase